MQPHCGRCCWCVAGRSSYCEATSRQITMGEPSESHAAAWKQPHWKSAVARLTLPIRALQQEGRLIAGQFASNTRPALRVVDTHTHLKMDRASTPWLSFADWEMGLARDLPWQILVSTSVGQVNLDLSNLILMKPSSARDWEISGWWFQERHLAGYKFARLQATFTLSLRWATDPKSMCKRGEFSKLTLTNIAIKKLNPGHIWRMMQTTLPPWLRYLLAARSEMLI